MYCHNTHYHYTMFSWHPALHDLRMLARGTILSAWDAREMGCLGQGLHCPAKGVHSPVLSPMPARARHSCHIVETGSLLQTVCSSSQITDHTISGMHLNASGQLLSLAQNMEKQPDELRPCDVLDHLPSLCTLLASKAQHTTMVGLPEPSEKKSRTGAAGPSGGLADEFRRLLLTGAGLRLVNDAGATTDGGQALDVVLASPALAVSDFRVHDASHCAARGCGVSDEISDGIADCDDRQPEDGGRDARDAPDGLDDCHHLVGEEVEPHHGHDEAEQHQQRVPAGTTRVD